MQMSGLRLDGKISAQAGGQNGKVILPGNAASSPLYQRVAGIGQLERMPMGGKPLPAAEISLIWRWIDEGAEWPDSVGSSVVQVDKHWAFLPPRPLSVPALQDREWPRNPIDSFVLARLEKEGFRPSPHADKITLLRRLSLDLIGLPPTIEEVDDFLRDKSPQAYEKQVERLLASPHYGERWGRQWLDAARYADSNGYEKDRPRSVWLYRDWVINALNRDLPYDQFIIQQIGGDLLPNATQDQVVATGFLRNSMINEEGGIDPEQTRMEAMFDRMDAIGKAILGVTIQCAQCHDHKYDPLTQEEYYRMFAFLNSTYEGSIAVYSPQEQMKRSGILRRTAEIEADLQHRYPDWRERMARWEEMVRNDQPVWIVLQPKVDENSTSGQRYALQKDGSILARGYAPARHRVKMTASTAVRNITAFRLELLTDRDLPHGGPGRGGKGTCALSEFEVTAAPAETPEKAAKIKFSKATADVNPPEAPLPGIFVSEKDKRPLIVGPVGLAIDGDKWTAWGIDVGPGLRNQSRNAVFTAEAPISFPHGTLLTFYLNQNHGGLLNSDEATLQNLGRFRLSVTTASGARADPLPKDVRDILAIPREQRTATQLQTVFRYWRTTVAEWSTANDAIAALWREYPEGHSQLVLQQREQPRGTHLLARGDFLQPGKAVGSGVPQFLNPLPAGPENRLTFARWLADRESPTTARAFVNRVWQSYFGAGIVATSENLGTQCEPPSHPELLDWLAVEFMDHNWSMKTLHRLIVTSATYQQSSNVTTESYKRDPYNRLLTRGPRFRVEAEMVRDIALTASGLLNPRIGGPSVFPPAPAFLFLPPASYAPKVWNESSGPERYRRALYTFRYRSSPYLRRAER
jgi:hypothetical protein